MKQQRNPLSGLLVTQFFGAFNDNAWKILVILLAMGPITLAAQGGDVQAAKQTVAFLALAVFTLPLLIFSLPAGVLCDRISKRTVILMAKALELGLMSVGTVVLFVKPHSQILPFIVLGLMGVQSALFSPAKYGILPELLPHEKLSAGNGLLELWTFVAIIAGTAAGGELLGLFGNEARVGEQIVTVAGDYVWIAGLVLAISSLVGLLAAFRVPPVSAARTEGGLSDTVRGAWRAIRSTRVLWLAVLGMTFYWTIASFVGGNVLVYSEDVLKLRNPGLPLAVFGLGVGVGGVIAGKLSSAKVEYGLIPLGALGLAVFTLLAGFLVPGTTGLFLLMGALGISSGLLVVPLNALVQWLSPSERRGSVIALANIFVFTGMLAGAGIPPILAYGGFSASGIFIGAGILTVAGTLWAVWLLPDAFLRLVLVLLTHTFYRLHVVDRQHVPEVGGALLVPNHVSFVDGLVLIASLDRPIRFVVDSAYFKHWFFGPFLRSLGAIPISASGGPRELLRAIRKAGEYLDDGELVCIFPEGEITRTGTLLPFRRGVERIVKGRDTSIVPVYLDRVWGSIFSRAGGRFFTKIPKQIPYPVTVSFGMPLPSDASAAEVRTAVQELSSAGWELRKPDRRPLHHSFVRMARRRPFAMAFADPVKLRMSRLQALVGAIALALKLRSQWATQTRVGILLPPSVGAALVNLAASLSARASVNLNYTMGRAGMTSAAGQANLKTIVTSREFLARAKLELPEGVEPLWIEDLVAGIGWTSKLLAMAIALLAPSRWIEYVCSQGRRVAMDDIVTIIFSSGSTGDPKGVLLSHFNIDSNVEGLAQVLGVRKDDRVLGILPLFHSFGYMSLWFAGNQGAGMAFLPNPLDAVAVGECVQRYRLTILIATPTFLQFYLRRCTPGQFGSLRLVLAGAEKLSERIANAFEDRFGVRPLEGYGSTECSPVISAGVPDFRAAGFYQPGNRRGTVGQPLPGISVRIVDRETQEPLPRGTAGLLLVRGPNVMQGYLEKDELTSQVVQDGWYHTGDIATMDEDGFIKIVDRLSRFSKIGGEMVPHGKVEDVLQQAAGADVQVFAVTAVPDEKKGERLAVLYTIDKEKIAGVLDKLAASGLPNLFIPRLDHFVQVDQLPVLGTGKLDLRTMKRVALNALEVTT